MAFENGGGEVVRTVLDKKEREAKYKAMDQKDLLVHVCITLDDHLDWHTKQEEKAALQAVERKKEMAENRRWKLGTVIAVLLATVALVVDVGLKVVGIG